MFQICLKYQNAAEFLIISKTLSEHKNWILSNILNINTKPSDEHTDNNRNKSSIYKESCLLLSKIHLKVGQGNISNYQKAYENAIQSENDEMIAISSKVTGEFLLAKEKNFAGALYKFRKMLHVTAKMNNISGMCEAHLLLFSTYLQLNDESNFKKHLQSLTQLAQKCDIPEFSAKAFQLLGQHYFMKNDDIDEVSFQ